MSQDHNQWNPKPWLEANPWSLLKPIGLSRRAYLVSLALWSAFVVGALVLHQPFDWGHLGLGFVGLQMLRYVLQRLRGVPAELSGPSEAITNETPFQFRLVVDLFASGFLLYVGAVLLLGIGVMRVLFA